MNNTYFNDDKFINSTTYQEFIKNNPGKGNLKIRAYAASEALPVSGLHIIVKSVIDNQSVIFFDGYTDASGMVEKISLPAPALALNDLDIPNTTTYLIDAIYPQNNDLEEFSVNMYDGICVVQNINYIPGGQHGS